VKKVVIIEDELNIAELLRLHLADLGADLVLFADGLEGFDYVSKQPFDLLILDINLPGMNGMDICSRLREMGVNAPIMMLTARTEEADKVMGLEIGADDYITKPFSIREFLARVKAIFRRREIDQASTNDAQAIINYKALHIDRRKRLVTKNEEVLELTPKEFDLLLLLASNPGVTYDRKELLNQVWGYDFEGYEHTVNSHINRLRNKLETNPNNPEYVLTTWGIGYKFNDQK
jgi:two-component system, OmpR family, alkaline phosphatase synthesis response regulator PhoP